MIFQFTESEHQTKTDNELIPDNNNYQRLQITLLHNSISIFTDFS